MLTGTTEDPWGKWLPPIACTLALGLFAYYVLASLHWAVIWDGAVMHYIHFLITRGFRPYTDITDMNLPGCYLTEGWAMAVFGWGDLSWRMYEYFLMGVLAASGMVIGGSRHWLAGIYAALLFTLMHGAEGPMMAVERDEVMTVLLVAGMACFFVSMRRHRPLLLLPFGLLSGLAVGLKPGAILLDTALLVLAVVTVARRGERTAPYIAWATFGNAAMWAVMFGFVLRYHALSSLLFVARHVLPYYVKEKNRGTVYLFENLLSPYLLPLVGIALASALVQRRKWSWERAALLLAVLSGFSSYWIQRKGYLYHRYMFTVFLVLWAGWELTGAQRTRRWLPRTLELAGMLAIFGWAAPQYAQEIYEYPRKVPPPQALAFGLERDLRQLGGGSLQQQVQCFDLVNGCLNALYRLRIVQSTGTTGDLLLFSPTPGPAVDYYRSWFTAHESLHPPTVIVLGNEYYHQYATSFDKIDTWPEYASFLRSNYVPVIERHFGHNNEPAYRIYLRKGSDVLAREQADPLH